jgi:putative transcriptional regulator
MDGKAGGQASSMTKGDDSNLTGQLLIAMPTMADPRFSKSLVYLCAHNEDGAMGLVVNRRVEEISFAEMLEQLEIKQLAPPEDIEVHYGGPVETARGFVLHSADYLHEGTLQVNEQIALTATLQVLRDIAGKTGPRRHLLALGYAGWGPGQLDSEIQQNAWLTVEADDDLIFGGDLDAKWGQAIRKLGFDPSMLSGAAGHA